MTTLEGKVALITGASRGIGAAVARQLAREGVKLGLASRSGDDLGITGVVAQPCDVRDSAQVEALVASTVEASDGSTSSSRMRVSAPMVPSSTSRPTSSRR